MNETEILIELLEKALPFLEKRMEESPQPDLTNLVDRIRAYSHIYHGDYS